MNKDLYRTNTQEYSGVGVFFNHSLSEVFWEQRVSLPLMQHIDF